MITSMRLASYALLRPPTNGLCRFYVYVALGVGLLVEIDIQVCARFSWLGMIFDIPDLTSPYRGIFLA
jgi:hypothetical protein